MGLQRLGRGLAAGLTTLGAGMHRDEQEAEDKRRFDEQSARAERQLQLQEQQAKQQADMAKLNLDIKKVEYNNKMLSTSLIQNKYGEKTTIDALNRYAINGGRIYKKNEAESSKQGKMVWDVGTHVLDKDGNPLLNDDGTKKWELLPPGANQEVFANTEELVNFVTPIMNPDFALAMQMQGITAEQTRQQAQDAFRKNALENKEFLEDPRYRNTPEGQKMLAEIERTKLEAKKGEQDLKESAAKTRLMGAQAESEKVNRGLATETTISQSNLRERQGKLYEAQAKKEAQPDLRAGESIMDSMTGEQIVRSKGETQQDLEVFRKAGTKYSDVTSVKQAYWINEVKENPAVRNDFKAGITAVLNNQITETDFLSKISSKGLSREFASEMLAIAQADAEEWKKSKNTDNLFERTWNKIFN